MTIFMRHVKAGFVIFGAVFNVIDLGYGCELVNFCSPL